MERNRERWRVAFGDVVEQYEAARPEYPDALVDDVLSYAGNEPGMPVLDVGPGTGKATRLFAGRGVRLTCLEPDRRMAQRLSTDVPGADVHVGDFESWSGPQGRYALLISAQAWHWIDPQVRWRRAREVLRPGGAIALFWHLFKVTNPALRADLVAAHRHRGLTTLDARVMEDWVRVPSVDRSVWPAEELAGQPGFRDVRTEVYPVRHSYTTNRFLDLLTTLSAYRALPDPVRVDLYTELSEIIRHHSPDETVALVATTQLTLGRTTSP